MAVRTCNYQKRISAEERELAAHETSCSHCGVLLKDLVLVGKHLEVCGEEFMGDPTTGEREFTTIVLCPDCHEEHHLDANGRHNPCIVKARQSREGIV
ncbi:MAG: hypothetical protein AAGF74_00135 [Pseudomonadota bacterium]